MTPKLHSISIFEKSFEMQELGGKKAISMSSPVVHFIVDGFPAAIDFTVYFAIIDLQEDYNYTVTVSILSPSNQAVFVENSQFRTIEKKFHPKVSPSMMAAVQVNLANIREEGRYTFSVSLGETQLGSIEFPLYKTVNVYE